MMSVPPSSPSILHLPQWKKACNMGEDIKCEAAQLHVKHEQNVNSDQNSVCRAGALREPHTGLNELQPPTCNITCYLTSWL